jgi:hypothetical protein
VSNKIFNTNIVLFLYLLFLTLGQNLRFAIPL